MTGRDVSHLGDFTATPRMLRIAALAAPVGAVSACVAWALLRLIGLISNAVFYHRIETGLVAPGAGHHNPLVVLLAPILGGLIIGLMARFGSEKIRGHGMPEAIEAILLGGSKVQPRVAVLKPVSAAVAIGTGGPFGAEGPIIMTGGAVGSLFAQFLRLTADERKTLLVAGAAAGMAATFNSPFAALLLAVELLLFEWRPRSYVPVATAVCVAAIVRRPLLGTAALFPAAGVLHLTYATYGLCVVSGIASGVLALLATVLVYTAEDCFRRLPIHWMWWPAIGGLIIGLGGLVVPQALGVGYNVIGAELDGSIGLGLVAGILHRQDPDLVAVARLGYLRWRAGSDVHDRRRARHSRGAPVPTGRAGFLGADRAGRGTRRGDAVPVHRRGVRARTHSSIRRFAAADHRCLYRLRRFCAAAQTLGAD